MGQVLVVTAPGAHQPARSMRTVVSVSAAPGQGHHYDPDFALAWAAVPPPVSPS